MDLSIASVLLLDGATNGAVYALLGLATVLVFTVTRVIFIPQGEFVAYGALTLAILQTGHVPGTVWLLLILAVVAALMEFWGEWQRHRHALVALKSGIAHVGISGDRGRGDGIAPRRTNRTWRSRHCSALRWSRPTGHWCIGWPSSRSPMPARWSC